MIPATNLAISYLGVFISKYLQPFDEDAGSIFLLNQPATEISGTLFPFPANLFNITLFEVFARHGRMKFRIGIEYNGRVFGKQ